PAAGRGPARRATVKEGVAGGGGGAVGRAPADARPAAAVGKLQRERREIVDAGLAVEAVEVRADARVDRSHLAAHRVARRADSVPPKVHQLALDPPVRGGGLTITAGRARIRPVPGAGTCDHPGGGPPRGA